MTWEEQLLEFWRLAPGVGVSARLVDGELAREDEFALGRACAVEAMGAVEAMDELRVASREPCVGDKGEPIWPADVAGSISHCRLDGSISHCGVADGQTYVVSVVARKPHFGVGIDVEGTHRRIGKIEAKVLHGQEAQWCEVNGEDPEHVHGLKLMIFSAKEAYYKWQYPRTNTWLGFKDVQLTVDAQGGTFEVEMLREQVPHLPQGTRVSGRFCILGPVVATQVITPYT